MSRQWNGWGDRYDAYGFAAGIALFLLIGSIEDYGTAAGGESWIFAAAAGAGGGYLTTFVTRLRAGERLDREPLPPTIPSYVLSVVMTVAAAAVLWGFAVGPIGITIVALPIFIATQYALSQVRRAQFRALRTAKHDGT